VDGSRPAEALAAEIRGIVEDRFGTGERR